MDVKLDSITGVPNYSYLNNIGTNPIVLIIVTNIFNKYNSLIIIFNVILYILVNKYYLLFNFFD